MSDYITTKGSVTAPIYVIVDKPYDQDKDKGYIFSGGYGYTFDRMLADAGLDDVYVCCRKPDVNNPMAAAIVENTINQFKPPIIIPLGEALGHFCPETKKKIAKKGKSQEESDVDLEKYAGSILTSDLIKYPHYVIPSLSPDHIVRNWDLRDICVNLDLGKARSELDYVKKHGFLEPLPEYNLHYNFEDPGKFPELLAWLDRYEKSKLLSVDIESIYMLSKSAYYGHPGYPVTIGMADNSKEGISFRLFRDSVLETKELWRKLYSVFANVELLGQNFFDFDARRIRMLGFTVDNEKITDTMIRQHILWPELPKKLQFLTRQYTRQPYYKDEGKQWNIKQMQNLKRYNCLDVVVTYAVYEAQELEFQQRPHLI